MADTLDNIALPRGVWIDLYEALGCAAGSQINVKNETDLGVRLYSGAARPDGTAYKTLKAWKIMQNDIADTGAWALSLAGDGLLNPQFLTYVAGVYYKTVLEFSGGDILRFSDGAALAFTE